MRAEFGKPVRREALLRAGGHCEAVGRVYGLDPGQRCNMPLDRGVEYDHYPVRAADGGTNDLNNCVAVCIMCHRWKTRTFDTPQAAKGKRVADKAAGITAPKRKWSSRNSFARHPDNSKQIHEDV